MSEKPQMGGLQMDNIMEFEVMSLGDWLTDLEALGNADELQEGITHVPLRYSPIKGLFEGKPVKQLPSVLQLAYPGSKRAVITVYGKFDPQGLARAIRGKEHLKGFAPVTTRSADDGGVDVVLYDKDTLERVFGSLGFERYSLKQLNAADAILRRKVNPKFNRGRRYRLKAVQDLQVDGCVVLLRPDVAWTAAAQMTLLRAKPHKGFIGAKGTIVANNEGLTGISIPEGYDGLLNLAELKINGFSVKEAPEDLKAMLGQEFPAQGDVTVCEGEDLFILRPIRLNIRKKGLSFSISMLWPEAGRRSTLLEAKRQAEALIKAKAKATSLRETLHAVTPYFAPGGVVGDTLKLCLKLGISPPAVVEAVERLWAAAFVRLVSQGPLVRQAFTTVMRGAHLKRGEVVIPQAMWQELFGDKPFRDGVRVELWRNPQLPGTDVQGRSLTAGTFLVKGLSDDTLVYLNPDDWATAGGDFDGDPVTVILQKPFGLPAISHHGGNVQKDKTSEKLSSFASVCSQVVPKAFSGLAAKLGIMHGLVLSLLDQAAKAGKLAEVENWLSLTGADFIQACVVTQKHRAIYTDPQGEVYSSDGAVGKRLSFEYMESVLKGIAEQHGLRLEPTKGLALHRVFRKASFGLEKAPLFMQRLVGAEPDGMLGEVLQLGEVFYTTPTQPLPVGEKSLKEVVLEKLRGFVRGDNAVTTSIPMEQREVSWRKGVIKEMVERLRFAQSEDPESLWSEDCRTGVLGFYRNWTQFVNGTLRSETSAIADLYRRICMMGWAINLAKDDWEAVRILAADWRLFRAVMWDKSPVEISDVNPLDLADRGEEA